MSLAAVAVVALVPIPFALGVSLGTNTRLIRAARAKYDTIQDLESITPPTTMDPMMDPESPEKRFDKQTDVAAGDSTTTCPCGSALPAPGPATTPRVVVFGDSLTCGHGYNTFLRSHLEAHGISLFCIFTEQIGDGPYCATSFGMAQCAHRFIARNEPDDYVDDSIVAVVFNSGLHDITSLQIQFSEQYVEVQPEEYLQNLKQFYEVIKKSVTPNCKFIFQTTTPVPPNPWDRKNADVIHINEIASNLFLNGYQPSVPVVDLYSPVVDYCRTKKESKIYPLCQCPALQQNADVHMVENGYKLMASVVANAIFAQLDLPLLDISYPGGAWQPQTI